MSSAYLSHQSLQWTRPLLDELCEEVREGVERFAGEDTVHRAEALDPALLACEKVAGSLAILQFDSGRMFAEAMGLALDALQQGESSDPDLAVSQLLEATATLPDFLDYLESTQSDAPLVVLPSINELRLTAGAEPLDEAEYFRPSLDGVELPEPTEAGIGPARIRRDYQHALRGILINSEDAEALDKLSDITLQVRDQIDLPAAVRRAGWTAAAVCEALKDRTIDGGSATTRLFARLDVMLKEAAEKGDSTELSEKADDLTRGLLLQVAAAGNDSAIASDVHAAFDLARQVPEQVMHAKVYLAGRNRGLLSAVTQAAREDLARIKDALGSQLERENDPDVLKEQTALLESVGESLAMVGLDRLATRVNEQAETLTGLSSDPDDPSLLRIARELLIVESQLEESFGLASSMDKDVEEDAADALLPPTERRRVVRQLVKEALEDLAHAKHLLDAVNRQKADVDSITEAQTILERISGALHVADEDRAAILVEVSSRIAGDHLGKTPDDGDKVALDALAETLTVTEFYLESRNSKDERGERYLDAVRTRLIGLGYWPETAEDQDEVPEEDLVETVAEDSDEEPSPAEFDSVETLEDLDFDELAGVDEADEETVSVSDLPEVEVEEPLDADVDLSEEAGEDLSVEPEDAAGAEESTAADDTVEATDSPEAGRGEESVSEEFTSSAFDDFDIVEIFLEEFDAELESLETLVPRWRDNPADEEDTTTIRRAFHSLKGSGRMADAGEIGEFSWQIESLLNRVLDGQIEADDDVTSLIALAVEALPSMRVRLSGEGEAEYDEQACAEIALRAEELAEGQPVTDETSEPVTAPELEGLDPTLIELMVKELSDNLESLEDWLCEAAESDHVEVIDERMVRVVHTMKGTMRLAPIGDEAETAQILEAYLEELQLCGAPPSSAGLTAMEHCADLFRSRLHRLQGDEVDAEKFQTGELAAELRALHNQAHRDRTGEHAPSFSPLASETEDFDHPETAEDLPAEAAEETVGESLEESSETPVEAHEEDLANEDFSSDFDGETVADTRADDFDVFDVDDEATTPDLVDSPDLTEGDVEATEEALDDVSDAATEELPDESLEPELAESAEDQADDQAAVEDHELAGLTGDQDDEALDQGEAASEEEAVPEEGVTAEEDGATHEEPLSEDEHADEDDVAGSAEEVPTAEDTLTEDDAVTDEAVTDEDASVDEAAATAEDTLTEDDAVIDEAAPDEDAVTGEAVLAEEGLESREEVVDDADALAEDEHPADEDHAADKPVSEDAEAVLEEEALGEQDEVDAEQDLEEAELLSDDEGSAGDHAEERDDLATEDDRAEDEAVAQDEEPVEEAELSEDDEPAETADTELAEEDETAEHASSEEDETETPAVDELEYESTEEADSDDADEQQAREWASVDSEFVPERYEQPIEPVAADDADENLVDVDYSEVNEDLLEAFLEEGQELLEHSDGLLQKWREEPADKSLVTALQRDLHTIKGSSRMVGLNPIGQVAHFMEELLEGIATGLKEPTQDRIDSLEAGCDQLNSMIEAVVRREPMPMRSLDELFAEQADELEDSTILPEITQQAQAAGQTGEETARVRAESLRVPSALIDELVNYAGEISIFRSRLEQQISIFRNNVGEVDETVIRLRDQLRKLEIETEAQILARYEREHGPADAEFDPLELDRYSTIQQLSRGLAESVNDLTSLTGILDDATRQSETLLMQQSRVNTELQEGLMQARMVSFNTLLPRFRRVVRNASREVEKNVQLQLDLSGESELDRNVLDRITAPLEHLLRNAVSHGIEAPEKRRELGKPETGTITIEVGREATELVMRVKDDGRGLDLDAIERQARERGLLKAGEEATDRALIQMIFQSGFSTASEVSELAGRGIGMDVVANEVRQIGGSVSAETDSGKGALFVIRIPLSLTVMQAIMVRASDRSFAIPLQAVRGVTRILADEWLREIESSEPSQDYAGESYPLLELEPQLDLDRDEVSGGTLSLLMIEAGEQRAALRVGELLGHREIVIKPVGPQISSIPGILGGTITADGQVIPILDMGPLIRRAFALDLIPGLDDIREAETTEEVKRTPLVLVVDDSITMRRVTSRVLEHRGLEVTTARDGLDAVEAMFDRVPDLILLDIEMPRMDGYELASHVRNDPRLKGVPMMMITSRSGEKHRQRARDLGVNDYLAKPYQESELVQHVFDLLQTTVPEG